MRIIFAMKGKREPMLSVRFNVIRKSAKGYSVKSEKGKNLGGPYKTRAAAAKRLRQVEYFKHKKG